MRANTRIYALMPRILLLILAGLIAVMYLALWSATQSAPQDQGLGALVAGLRLSGVPELGLNLVFSIGSALLIIFVASVAGSEFTWKTIRSVLPRSSGRPAFIMAKLSVAFIFLAAVVAVDYLAALVASFAVTILGDLPSDAGANFVGRSALSASRIALALLPYVSR